MVDLPLGVQSQVFRKIYRSAVSVGGAGAVCGSIPAAEGVANPLEGVAVQGGIGIHGHLLDDGIAQAAVGVKGDCHLGLGGKHPLSALIDYAIPCLHLFRLGVGVVSIFQLGGRNGNLMGGDTGTTLCVLVSHRLAAGCANLTIHTCAVTADVCAVLGGIDAALGAEGAVHIHFRVHKIFGCAAIGSAVGKGHRDSFGVSTNVVVCIPLILVVDNDFVAAGDDHLRALCNGCLDARQQGRILVHRQLAAGKDVDGHIVGQGQNIILGVNLHSHNRQIQVVDLRGAVDRIDDPVSRTIIPLGQAAAGYPEHTFVTHEGNGGWYGLSAGV